MRPFGLEIRRRESGEPEVFLTRDGERFTKANNIAQIKISLTHAQPYAAANAVVLGS